MEAMFQKYKDIAEFRMIYIREAHAADSSRPVPYAKEKGINQQTDYHDRCTTAEMLLNDKQLTMPFLIDAMDNATNTAYQAHPDRVFLVRTDGKLAIAASRGPAGFKPALKSTEQWLEEARQFVGVISVAASSIQLILQNRIAGRYTNDNSWQFFAPGDTSMERVAFITTINYPFGKEA